MHNDSKIQNGAKILPAFTKIVRPMGNYTLFNIFTNWAPLTDKSIVPFYASNYRNSNQLKIDQKIASNSQRWTLASFHWLMTGQKLTKEWPSTLCHITSILLALILFFGHIWLLSNAGLNYLLIFYSYTRYLYDEVCFSFVV